MIRAKYFAINWGYHIGSDCPFGLTIALGHREGLGSRYRAIFDCYWDWPKFHWVNENWAMNEQAMSGVCPLAVAACGLAYGPDVTGL